MPVDLGGFRQNLQDMFAAELQVKMLPGQLEGPNEGTGEWRGSCTLLKVVEDKAVAQVNIFALCRFYAPFSTSSGGVISPAEPYDPAPLEDMALKIQVAVARNQTGLGAWFQRLTAIEFDNEDQGLQATIFAYASNTALGFDE